MTIWFTADTHFGHARIIEYEPKMRGHFSSIEEHDQQLIDNWNARVRKGDLVYHLGDFAFAKPARVKEIVDQLNGQIYHVQGNHDVPLEHKKVVWSKLYAEISPKVDGQKQKICLFHFPIQSWNKNHRGSWHLHGHSHNHLRSGPNQKRLDVGVDAHYLSPISLEEVVAHMATKGPYIPEDHHV